MSVNGASGVRLWVGETDEPDILAEFAAQSWVEVNNIEDLGEFGDESGIVTFTALKDARTQKFKGPRDAGNMALVVGDDPMDPGQHILQVAETTKFNYAFKVQLNDALTLGGQGSIHYFIGRVLSSRRNNINANSVVKRTFTVGINSPQIDSNPT